jgi:hypothetical protein
MSAAWRCARLASIASARALYRAAVGERQRAAGQDGSPHASSGARPTTTTCWENDPTSPPDAVVATAAAPIPRCRPRRSAGRLALRAALAAVAASRRAGLRDRCCSRASRAAPADYDVWTRARRIAAVCWRLVKKKGPS